MFRFSIEPVRDLVRDEDAEKSSDRARENRRHREGTIAPEQGNVPADERPDHHSRHDRFSHMNDLRLTTDSRQPEHIITPLRQRTRPR